MYLSLKGSLGHTAITDRVGESLLQIAEGSSAAYSLRNLGSDSPSVIRVRRGSDNAERDFTAQDINTSVVEEWVNADDPSASGFVETWYDQSGNGNNASQLTAAYQPKIVDAGVLVTSNGNAAIKSTSINEMTFSMASLSSDGQQSVFSVLENDITSQDSFSLPFGVDSTSAGTRLRRPYWYVSPDGTLTFSVDSTEGYNNTSRERHLYSHIMDDSAGGTSTIYQEGTQVHTQSITLDANPSFSQGRIFALGSNITGAFYMSELIYYPSDQSANRPAIEDNIDNHYGIISAGSYVNAAGDSYINAAGDTYLQP
tara:strand:+ start:48 stop:986 length:939 start_codon:yes stop_codon:yes gene_type:complete